MPFTKVVKMDGNCKPPGLINSSIHPSGHDVEFFLKKNYWGDEPLLREGVLIVHSKITFSIARNVIMIGLLFNEELP